MLRHFILSLVVWTDSDYDTPGPEGGKGRWLFNFGADSFLSVGHSHHLTTAGNGVSSNIIIVTFHSCRSLAIGPVTIQESLVIHFTFNQIIIQILLCHLFYFIFQITYYDLINVINQYYINLNLIQSPYNLIFTSNIPPFKYYLNAYHI